MKTAIKNSLAVIMVLIMAAIPAPKACADGAAEAGTAPAEISGGAAEPGAAEMIEVSGSKTWDDGDNRDGIRPESITVRLMADGAAVDTKTVAAEDNWSWTFIVPAADESGAQISYSVAEEPVEGYTASVNGYNITNTHSPETAEVSGSKTWDDGDNRDGMRPASIRVSLLADGDTVDTKTVTAEDGWAWKFTGLPKYKDGAEIKYAVSEEPVEGYTSSVNGYNITNTHSPETTEVSGSKTWDDSDNRDGMRPASITVNLLADGVKKASLAVTPDGNGVWAWTFKGLPIRSGEHEIVYTVTEEPVKGYVSSVDGYSITNTHKPEILSVSGSKTWVDSNNQDGIRPASATVNLLKNGEMIDSRVIKPDASGNWEWSFTDLPRFEAGAEIKYTITEDPVAGYTTVITGYNIANTHTPEKTDFGGVIIWNDDGNRDGKRPASVRISLLKNGTRIDGRDIKPDSSGNWRWNFAELPKFELGKAAVYTVTEDAVAEYTSAVNGSSITNTHEPEKITLSVSKTWIGGSAKSAAVHLYADGAETASFTLSKDNGWKHSFSGLYRYSGGKEIAYTLTEDAVAGYYSKTVSTRSGFKVINTNVKIPMTGDSGSGFWGAALALSAAGAAAVLALKGKRCFANGRCGK